MDYKYVESLLLSTKEGDKKSQETLIKEFKPFILNLSKKTFLPSYTKEDIQEECVLSLLKAIQKYNPETHKFVAYATNTIKNNLNYLIRNTLKHKSFNGPDSLTFTGSLEELDLQYDDELSSNIIYEEDKKLIEKAMLECLTLEQREQFIFVKLKRNSLKEYAKLKNISYCAASKRNSKITHTLADYFYKESSRI